MNKIDKLNEYLTNILFNHAHIIIYNGNNYDTFFDQLSRNLKEIYKVKIDNFIEIKPEGKQIKKEQIIELKKQLKFNNNKNFNFYLIFSAEKMNDYAYNALLKFLEEPLNNSVAILVTNSINLIAPTIKSRCVVFNYNDFDENKEKIENIEFLELEKIMMGSKYQQFFNSLTTMIKESGSGILEKYILYLLNQEKNKEKINLVKMLSILESNVNVNLIIDHLYLLHNKEVKA